MHFSQSITFQDFVHQNLEEQSFDLQNNISLGVVKKTMLNYAAKFGYNISNKSLL